MKRDVEDGKKLAEAEYFVETNYRKQQQLAALQAQIQEKEAIKAAGAHVDAGTVEGYKENPFARNERLVELYQKQKAKQVVPSTLF